MITYLGSLVQSCCGKGGPLQTHVTGVCGEHSQCFGHTGLAPTHGVCAFPIYIAQVLGCSVGNCLMRALIYLHFPGLSHSGSGSWVSTKTKTHLGLHFVPSQVRAAQTTRRLVSTISPRWGGGGVHLVTSPSLPLSFLGGCGRAPYQVCRVSSGELLSGCGPPGGCQPSRIPRSLG